MVEAEARTSALSRAFVFTREFETMSCFAKHQMPAKAEAAFAEFSRWSIAS
jgi:hypothetical protein